MNELSRDEFLKDLEMEYKSKGMLVEASFIRSAIDELEKLKFKNKREDPEDKMWIKEPHVN